MYQIEINNKNADKDKSYLKLKYNFPFCKI